MMAEDAVSEAGYAQIQDLKRQNEALQRAMVEMKQEMMSRLVLSELKAEAVRAGIVDLDGLRLLDLDKACIGDDDNVKGAADMIEGLKARKPWLFQAPSSSSSSTALPTPPAQPAPQKLATEMTDAEYRIARAQILKLHSR